MTHANVVPLREYRAVTRDYGHPVDLGSVPPRPGTFHYTGHPIRFGELTDGRWYVEVEQECRAFATRQDAQTVAAQLQERFSRLWDEAA